MLLNVLTAVSRPENLPRIAESLATAVVKAPNVKVCWRWGWDLERRHVGGQAVKNALLDDVEDGWVWILDDDTLVHPDVLTVVQGYENAEAVVVAQQRTDGRVLWGELVVGSIDVGQVFLRRHLIVDHRIPETYDGDGYWLIEVLEDARVKWVDDVLSLHNAISGVNIGV